MRTGWLAVIATLMVLAAGCTTSAPPTAPPTTTTTAGVFVGTVDGTDTYIAILSDGSAVAGYACDGQQFSRWLGRANLASGTAALTGRDGTALGHVTITDATAAGELTIDGVTHLILVRSGV